MNEVELQNLITSQCKQKRVAIEHFVRSAEGGDVAGMVEYFHDLNALKAWWIVMKAVAHLKKTPPETRGYFEGLWQRFGDSIRYQCGDDLALATGLRKLLPPYQGGAVQLFRGDSALNRNRRTYGLTWSFDQSVAERYARGVWRTFDGGSVLLETLAEPDAIVACVGRKYDDVDYIIDRRQLTRVAVLKRYSQIDWHEMRVQRSGED